MTSRTSEELLAIGEVSRRTGAAVSAIRYYESLGLVTAHRTAGGTRRFPRHTIRRISIIAASGVQFVVFSFSGRAILDATPGDRRDSRARHRTRQNADTGRAVPEWCGRA